MFASTPLGANTQPAPGWYAPWGGGWGGVGSSFLAIRSLTTKGRLPGLFSKTRPRCCKCTCGGPSCIRSSWRSTASAGSKGCRVPLHALLPSVTIGFCAAQHQKNAEQESKHVEPVRFGEGGLSLQFMLLLCL